MPDTTPFEQAQLVYKYDHLPRSFPEDLSLHLHFGWVISTPTVFLMGRPVKHDAPYSQITDPAVSFENPDCWFVYLCAGNIRDALRLAPWPLPFVAWDRDNVLRVFPFEKVAGKAGVTDDTEQSYRHGDALLQEQQCARTTAPAVATVTHDSSRGCCKADARVSP